MSDTNLISVESKNVISEVVPLDSLKDDHKNFEESNILEIPDNSSDDCVGISDVPIMKISSDNVTAKKPLGSAYIHTKMSIGRSNKKSDVYVCIDTGADLTICDSAFLIHNFGENALNQIAVMNKPPKLRSASNHYLKILGKLKITLYLGSYELNTHIIVYDGKKGIFLLGSDIFYDRLIFDRGIYLAFADSKHSPIPIHYELAPGAVKSVTQYQVAPRSNALIQVKVVNGSQFTGKEVVLSPVEENEHSHISSDITEQCMQCQMNPVRNTISKIDSNGNSLLLVHNDTDDILTILPDKEIAKAELITSNVENINHVDDSNSDIIEMSLNEKDEKWPISALKGELKEKLPFNVIVQWDNVISKTPDNINQDSPCMNINYIHDKAERKDLLDGTGEGFPTPNAADPEPKSPESNPDPESWLENVVHSHLTDEQWLKLKALLIKYRDAFSKSKTEIGCCNYFKVDLPLKPGTGYLYNKPRPLPIKHREIAAETISELLAKGVIRPSKSPHATNIVCVKKKTMNGVVSYRVCCDLRQVNEHSIPNRFPNFWIEDAMGKIQGACFRTALDFKDAFHMLVLTEESIPITAFYFNNVLYEYVRVPFGHVCAMNAFCCLMALLCVGYNEASYYADDLMITTKVDHAKTHDQLFDLHLEHIGGMLARIIDAGLKLVAHKCMWAYDATKPMDWLGFTMENNLLKPQEAKVKAIKEYPVPTTAKQVISFVATASFYRRFIKSFAKIAQPMYTVANTEPFVWTDAAQKSFENLKEIMCSDLVLRLPRQGEPFQMYTDASAGAIGVVLCQIDPIDKKSHPCAYGSRKFNECELKLSIPCKELLAIVYGLNLWSFYICGNPIQVFSDCRAWTFLTKQSGASGRISRLALLISEFDISISYVKGTQNKAADGLSRAYDDGLVKYDDLITARHPALNKLEAPELPPGEVMKLGEYLTKCDDFLESHWPKLLKEYEAENPKGLDDLPEKVKERELMDKKQVTSKVDEPPVTSKIDGPQVTSKMDVHKVLLEETDYVDRVIQEATLVHMDKSSGNINQMRKYYPFQVNDMDEDESLVISDESDLLVLNDESTDEEEVEGTTDSSFKAACYNVKLVAINESSFSLEAFQSLQQEDSFCSEKIDQLKKKRSKASDAGYFLKRKILMRKMETTDGQINNVICVPLVLVKSLLESTHRSLLSGHFGSQRYYLNMSRKYYWPGMKQQIIEFHNNCLPCLYNDKFPVKYTLGHVIRPLWPMHVVHCDLMVGLPRALDGSTAILLLYDGFSRFTYGIALTSEKADYCVKKLMSHFVAAFGLPWALHSDNGRNVDGALIRHLALMLGVIKTSTPPHTPNANPTETMCAAVAQLLRKGLNQSDQRYWSLCLPFVLNALNSTVHTATGYTPNSLFFGRYQERDPVPLIPFDCESSNVNEYFQKMRRFQELSFQIVRSRNERKLQSKKESWDETAHNPAYNVGDYVLVKNNNPASGPGKMKLRAKYIGPFRVIKVYLSSLIVVPWTQNSRLEEYYKDPNVFRLMHRGDIRPFHTRQVSVRHCKPFKGEIKTEEIVDPIMLSRFLDDLGVNNDAEIISEIDTESSFSDNTRITSESGSIVSGGPPPGSDDDGSPPRNPPRYDDPDPPISDPPNPPNSDPEDREKGPPDYDSEVERFIDNLDISDADKELLRCYCQIKDEIRDFESYQSQKSTGNVEDIDEKKLDNLKILIQSADPVVRERAEFEFQQLLDDIKYVKQQELLTNFSKEYEKFKGIDSTKVKVETIKSEKSEKDSDSSSEYNVAGNAGPVLNPVPVPSNPASPTNSEAELSDDENDSYHSGQSGHSGLTWDPGYDPPPPQMQATPDININLPNININIRQPQATGSPGVVRTPTGATRFPSMDRNPFARKSRIARSPVNDPKLKNVANWLIGQSPQHGPPIDPNLGASPILVTPQVTRSGRISRPVAKFDPAVESRLQQDTQTAIKKSVKRLQGATTELRTTVSPKPAVESEKPKHSKTGTIAKKSVTQSRPEVSKAPTKSSRAKTPELDKGTTVSRKTVISGQATSVPGASKSAIIAESEKEAMSDINTGKDISKRSTKTARTPPPN